MEQPHPTPPETKRTWHGRVLAGITRVTTREKGYIFAHLIDTGDECFLHKSTIPSELWDVLDVGHAITCKVSETSKGLRGYEVAAGDVDDQARVTVEEEDRGNRG